MVKKQIENRGITSGPVLEAMGSVERHRFVPEKYLSEAYGDHPLPIGYGQTISQPYIVALMTEAIAPDTSMIILEIGTGSGYQAAVLSLLCKKVYSIEIVEPLGRSARKLLAQLGYSNVEITIGDGYKGWKEHAPYDAIIVTCAPTDVPKPLAEQLAEGGKMVIPVGRKGFQELVLLTKSEGQLVRDTIIPVRFVPMVDSSGSTY
jgi:protein-L-isoaspartate(D-aspartate) O-methyltransferase